MRTESRLIIICSCWDAKKMAVKKYSTGRDYEQSLAVFHSSHLSDNRKIKLYPISVQNPHHNMLSGNIYVSSSGKEFITGDVRGLIVFYKYTDETTSYKSSVLTVVPGSIVDLKLSEGYLLLITCCLPSEVSLSSTIAHDILEVVHSYALTYYLFNMNTRKLIKLDLNNLLPSSLGLNISCVSPVWLYDSDLHFACTLSYISTLPSSNPLPNETNNSDTFYLCAIFSINKGDREDNIQVDLHSLMPVEKTSFINQSNRLRVLPSQISVDLAYTTIDRADNNELEWNQFKSCMLNAASGLHALSSDILVFWSRSTNHKQSLFALLQPSLCTRKALLTTLNTKLPLIKSLNVLTYSQQLGEICTISPLWLKPCHNYAARSRAFGGIGLEVWIVRRLPQGYELNNSEVIVLSTRPLRAHLVALAPNVTYTDFANANRSALIRSVIQQKITTTSIKHPINDMLQATRSHPSLLTASSFCSSSSSSSLSSKASIQSQRLCSNSVTVYDHQRSRLSFSSGKYQSEIFKMSVFVPWPTIPLRVGNMHKLNIFKVSSDVIDGYDIGVDACTLLGDECESSSYLSSKVNDLTNSTSDLFLTSKSQLQSALSAPSADTYASSEVNVVIQSSDDTPGQRQTIQDTIHHQLM
ncbi:unnamed protein product [Heterobilharzia americana]|nr:unnamed protein product [Heterobilharzia americana]